jgi:two-component system, chemotaxis family, protein-glutamate methylesterase/glutaminase
MTKGGDLSWSGLDVIQFIRKHQISDELLDKVKAAANVPMTRMQKRTPTLVKPALGVGVSSGLVDVVVLGISTGGPQALKALIPRFPADFPVPMALVLHMPVGYTEMYARKLNEICELRVEEAREGDLFEPGSLLVAPAGKHLSFVKDEMGNVFAHLHNRPFDTPHRPAVDVLFRSAAETFHNRTLGVVMTGMGYDGRQGAAWIKAQGGMIFTEAEETCIVYGMPGAVVEAGLSDRSIPLDRMAEAIIEVV